MKNIKDYKILIVVSNTELEKSVKELIDAGYQPYGFMQVSGEYQYQTFIQAMVKYE